jgi:hypothetical protein
MAKIVAAAGTSHAFALRNPEEWDASRKSNRQGYARRFGNEPEEHPNVAQETDEDIKYRYSSIRKAHDMIVEKLGEGRIDALIVIGDDQNENFTEQTYIPQMAIYTGEQFKTRQQGGPPGAGTVYQCHPELAEHLYTATVDAGFDTVGIHSLPDDILRAHAIGPVLERVVPEADIRIVPVWVEGIHVPAPSPARCYAFGQALAKGVESWPGNERVAVVASGGISHYTAGYPYKHAPNAIYGNISVDFDRKLFDDLGKGKTESWSSLTNADLLEHGDPELRSWITMLGMIGKTAPESWTYEPFFRGIMGMGVAYWQLEPAMAGSR